MGRLRQAHVLVPRHARRVSRRERPATWQSKPPRYVELTWQQHLAINALESAAQWEDRYAQTLEFWMAGREIGDELSGAIMMTLLGGHGRRTTWRIEEDGTHSLVAQEPNVQT
jgi:hypothetical protein